MEKDRYIWIMGRGANWFRYLNNVLVIMPKNVNVENKLRMLNAVNRYIQYTVEQETGNKFPFLDTVVQNSPCTGSPPYEKEVKAVRKVLTDASMCIAYASGQKLQSALVFTD